MAMGWGINGTRKGEKERERERDHRLCFLFYFVLTMFWEDWLRKGEGLVDKGRHDIK